MLDDRWLEVADDAEALRPLELLFDTVACLVVDAEEAIVLALPLLFVLEALLEDVVLLSLAPWLVS